MQALGDFDGRVPPLLRQLSQMKVVMFSACPSRAILLGQVDHFWCMMFERSCNASLRAKGPVSKENLQLDAAW